MDPVSVTASILTLVAAAGQSCKFASSLVSQFSSAQDDIKRHFLAIDALATTLRKIDALLDTLPATVQIDPEFARKLTGFVSEVREIEVLAHDANHLVGGRGGQRARARVKWVACGNKRWGKFIKDLALWNTVFSSELQAIQISMTQILLERNPASPSPRNTREVACQASPIPNEPRRATTRGRVAKALHRFEQPVGVQVAQSYKMESQTCSGRLDCGPVVVCQLSADQHPTYRVLSASMACQLSITVQLIWDVSFKVTWTVFSYRKLPSCPGLNLSMNLRFSTVVPDDCPAFFAAKSGDVRTLKQLLSSGQANMTDVTTRGDTLLHVATKYGRQEMIVALLELGSEVNRPNDQGVTSLHLAVWKSQNDSVVRLLLDNGADINIADRADRTPLHHIFYDTIHSILVDPTLGVSTTNKDKRGMTIAHYVTWTSLSTVEDFILVLAATGLPITECDGSGRSFLHLAARRGNLGLMRHLLAHPSQAALRVPDNHGRTPVHYAAESSRAKEAIYLLTRVHGMSVQTRDKDGQCPLHHAAARDNVPALQRLIELGAQSDLDIADKQGRTPIQLASAWKAEAAVQYLAKLPVLVRRQSEPADPKLTDTHKLGGGFSVR